jgi:signal peptidase II
VTQENTKGIGTRFKPGVFVFIGLLAFLLDQLSKFWVEASLTYREVVPVAPLLSMYRVYNEGIAFSMFDGFEEWGLIALAIVVLIFISMLWQSTEPSRWMSRLGYALIWGGALGNVIDRAFRGHVVDFILVHTESWSFAIFNIADSFITVGAGLVILDEFLAWRRGRAEVSD